MKTNILHDTKWLIHFNALRLVYVFTKARQKKAKYLLWVAIKRRHIQDTIDSSNELMDATRSLINLNDKIILMVDERIDYLNNKK